jgi:nucleotide-binding universal stress UspA family protein
MALNVKAALPVAVGRRARRVVEYRNILVPLWDRGAGAQAMAIACRLAAERHSSVTALAVIEVPAELPLESHMFDEEADAKHVLGDAAAIGDLYGIAVVQRMVRARMAGEAVVDEAKASSSEIIVLSAPRRGQRRRRIFGTTVDFVLKHAGCRVMVAALPEQP